MLPSEVSLSTSLSPLSGQYWQACSKHSLRQGLSKLECTIVSKTVYSQTLKKALKLSNTFMSSLIFVWIKLCLHKHLQGRICECSKSARLVWSLSGGTESLWLTDRGLSETLQGGEKTDSQKQNTGSFSHTVPVCVFKTVVWEAITGWLTSWASVTVILVLLNIYNGGREGEGKLREN